MTHEQRLVHLDLKGAPPKLSYLEQVFPLLQKWGVTGLLVEYEDTFPYEGRLKVLQAEYAYTLDEIKRLQELASKYNFEFIPLVQTFGHFEFVLKHDTFRHLREVTPYPMALCPCNDESLSVIMEMICQLMAAHPHVKFFHIGADEVPSIGSCNTCKAHMASNGLDKEAMFVGHVRKVLEQVQERWPEVKAIMWDDMFRNASAESIRNSGIGDMVEPMVWYYQRSFNNLPLDVFERYSVAFKHIWIATAFNGATGANLFERYSVAFKHIWIATAFKGATGASMFVTDIGHHIENHRGWLALEESHVRPHFTGDQAIRGYCLTGWSRYDHYATLCELLPVGLPSLAVCLLVLKHRAFTEQVHAESSADLKFSELIPLNPHTSIGVIPACDFPGCDIYRAALRMLQLKADHKMFTKDDRLRAWMTPYHVRYNFTNPAHLYHFLPTGRMLLNSLSELCVELSRCLSRDFYPDLAEEFVASVVKPRLDEVADIVHTAQGQLTLMAGVKHERSAAAPMESD